MKDTALIELFLNELWLEKGLSENTVQSYRLDLTVLSNCQFVPQQNFDEEWTDEKLYKKYGLTPEEIAYIEKMVRPME